MTDCYAREGALDRNRLTECHRIALTVLALGGDPTAFGRTAAGDPVDLIAAGTYAADREMLEAQGLNSLIYALITLDAAGADLPEAAEQTRQWLLATLLAAQEPDGGFGLRPGSGDVDITAMALQALAPYADREQASRAVEAALDWLKTQCSTEGTFESFGVESAESVAR